MTTVPQTAPPAAAEPSAIDRAVAFAKQVVSVVDRLTPLLEAANPPLGGAIALGAKIVSGGLDAVTDGETLWTDLKATASGAAAPSAAVLAASIAAANAANDQLARDDAAELARQGA